jgi:hypothetical protein
MTDDFHLFGDPSDGNEPIDPDVALVTAYLARELSPMQVIALEERLATDSDFRSEMQPLIDAWAAPVPSLENGLSRRAEPLSVLERAESWRRFQSEGIPAAPTEPISLPEAPARTIRRISMKRVALLTAAIALPMVSFAEVVVYTANHAGVPGHEIAQRVVSAFAHAPQSPVNRSDSSQPTHVTALTDGRVPRSLTATKTAPETAKAPETIPVATPTAPIAAAPAPKTPSLPNRALIAELTRRNQPGLVRGDTSAEYLVMVLDAADGYVWSTIGDGNLGIEVGADSRSAGERAAFTAEYRDEFWGNAYYAYPAGRGRGMEGGFGRGAGGRGRGGAVMQGDSLVTNGRGFGGRGVFMSPDSGMRVRVARGGLVTTRITTGDTVYTLRYDSLFVHFNDGRGVVGQGVIGLDSMRRGFGGARGRGRGGFAPQDASGSSRGYRAGLIGNAAGAAGNRAFGLEAPSAERSGIQGLVPSFVESAETYFFAPRELTSANLRVMVVHLTPSATWRGPS